MKLAEKLQERIENKYDNASTEVKLKMVSRGLKRLERNLVRLERKTDREINHLLEKALKNKGNSGNNINADISEANGYDDTDVLNHEETDMVGNLASEAHDAVLGSSQELLPEILDQKILNKKVMIQNIKQSISVLKIEKSLLENAKESKRSPASITVGSRIVTASIFMGVSVTFVVSGGLFMSLVFGVAFLVLGICGIAVAIGFFASIRR